MARHVAVCALGAALGLAACSSSGPGASSKASTTSTFPSSSTSTTASSTAWSTTAPPTTAATSTSTTTPAIVVTSPRPGATATSPLRVTGTADVFEATFQLEILDSNGTVLVQQSVHATSGSGTRGTFDTTLRFATQHPGPGSLLAYDLSPKDGSRQDLVRIPLQLAD